MKPHEKYAAHRPRVGAVIVYKHTPVGTVTHVEGGLCWHTGDDSGPFIWCFGDGVNALHDWPGREGAKVAFCPGSN